jgi:signal transduction histidine kinase
MKWPFSRNRDEDGAAGQARPLAERIQELVEESEQPLLVIGAENRIVAASRVARETVDGVVVGEVAPQVEARERAVEAQERAAAYEELRAGFTAAVSHELRTPLARLMALLDTATLPGEDPAALAEQARREVEQIRELIDDVLFLSELETGRAVVALGATRALPVVEQVFERFRETADRADVTLRAVGELETELPLRPRMLRVVIENLVQNAIRYAGAGSTLTISVRPGELEASDDGVGVAAGDLPRLFERFYRADRVRGSRGTGLGLAVVKHIVVAGGGTVEAVPRSEHGLTIRCTFTE